MISNVPISPPVTPKDIIHEEFHAIDQEFLLLSPIDHDLRRKSNVRRFSRAMDMTLSYTNNKKKSTPKKSLPPTTRGYFTMDLQKVLKKVSRKRPRMSDSTVTQTASTSASAAAAATIQPIFSTSSILNTERHVKKAKTDAAAAYDCVDISIPDNIVFQNDPKWIPNMKIFEQKPVKVNWKGSPLKISHLPYYQELHPGEVNIASTLRLTPEQYLKCRRSLILAAQDFDKMNTTFRKSDAQKCVRIDVNKTSALWSVFSQLGWFNPY